MLYVRIVTPVYILKSQSGWVLMSSNSVSSTCINDRTLYSQSNKDMQKL